MTEDVSGANAGRLYLEVVGDTSGLREDLRVKLDAIARDLSVSIKAQVQVDAAKAKADIDEVTRDRSVRATLTASTDTARGDIDDAARDRDVTLKAKADTAQARADLDTAARNRDVTIKAKTDTSTLSQSISDIGSKLSSLGTKGMIGAGLTEAVGAAGNLAGALVAVVAAASQAAGVIGVLPGLLAAAGQGAGVVMLGFSGITDAVKAMSTAQQQSGQDAHAMAEAQQQAQDRVRTSAQALASAQVNSVQAVQSAQHALQQSIISVANAQYDATQSVQNAQHALQQSVISVANTEYDALNSVQSAEHSLTDAQYAETQAQVQLTQARHDAQQQLLQLQFQLRGAVLGEAQASLNLAEAKIKLQQTMQSAAATPYQRQQAALDVQQAQLALDEANAKTKETAYQKQLADKRGVEGSQTVVQARHAESDATWSLSQAESSLAHVRITAAEQVKEAVYAEQQARQAAARAVILAQQSVANADWAELQARQSLAKTTIDSQNQLINAQISYNEAVAAARYPLLGVSSATTTLQQAMAHLSPAGRDFARFIEQTLVPDFRKLRMGVQQAFLPGVQEGVTKALPLLAVMDKGLTGTATVLGGLAVRLGGVLGSKGFGSDLGSVMRTNNVAIRLFGDGMLHVLDILRNITVAAEPLVLRLAGAFDHLMTVLDQRSRSARQSGGLEDFFKRSGDAALLLAHIVGNLVVSIGHIFKASAPAGTSLLTSLNRTLITFRRLTGSASGQQGMEKFFARTEPVVRQVGDALVRVLGIIGNLAKATGGGQFNSLFATLNIILSILNTISKIPGLGPVLNWILALSAAGAGVGKVAENISKIGTGLTGLTRIPGLKQVLGATGITARIEALGTRLKEPGSVSGALKSGISKIIGQKAVPVSIPGADRVFSVGADGTAGVTGLEESGEGVIAATGLRGVAARAGGLLSSGSTAVIGGVTAALSNLGSAAGAAGAAVSRAFSTAVGWVTSFAGNISVASIRTAIYSAGAKLAALATGLWETATGALSVAMDFLAANPIVAIIAGLAALAAAVAYAYTHFAWFRDGVNTALRSVASIGLWLWHDVFDPLYQGVAAGATWLYDHAIKPYFTAIGLELQAVQAVALFLWRNVFEPMYAAVGQGATWLYDHAIKPYFDLVIAEFQGVATIVMWLWHNVFDPMYHGILTGAANTASGLKTVWDGIRAIFEDPVKFVVNTVYDDGIAKVWNWVAGAVHLPKLPVIKMHTGGVVPGHGHGDKVPALLEPRERILALGQVAAFGGGSVDAGHAVLDSLVGRGTGGPVGYQGGGIINWFTSLPGDIGHLVTHGAAALLNAGKFLASALINPAGTVKRLLSGPLGQLSRLDKTPVGHLIAGIPRTIADGIGHLVSSAIGGLFGGGNVNVNVSGTATDWFRKAIQLTGVPMSWLPPLEVIGQHESAMNPRAINNSDSNAAAGDPSRGIMQTIMTTFLAFHQRGTSDNIYDPVANIAAAIKYIIAKYQTVFNVPGIRSLAHGGQYVGYDTGGPVRPGANWLLNSTGRDEWVLVPEAVDMLGGAAAVAQLNMSARLYKGSTAVPAVPAAAARRGTTDATVNVFPQPYQSEEEIGTVAARKLGLMLA